MEREKRRDFGEVYQACIEASAGTFMSVPGSVPSDSYHLLFSSTSFSSTGLISIEGAT